MELTENQSDAARMGSLNPSPCPAQKEALKAAVSKSLYHAT